MIQAKHQSLGHMTVMCSGWLRLICSIAKSPFQRSHHHPRSHGRFCCWPNSIITIISSISYRVVGCRMFPLPRITVVHAIIICGCCGGRSIGGVNGPLSSTLHAQYHAILIILSKIFHLGGCFWKNKSSSAGHFSHDFIIGFSLDIVGHHTEEIIHRHVDE